MKRRTGEAEQVLYEYLSCEGDERIETCLVRDGAGRLSLKSRLAASGGEDAVTIPDLGRREESCLAFARAVAESHTHPRVLPELWEEFEP